METISASAAGRIGPALDEVLAALDAGLIGDLTAERLVWEHLAAVCRECRSRLDAALAASPEATRFANWLERSEPVSRQVEERAQREYRRLLNLEPGQDLESLAAARARYRQPLTVALLLDDALGQFHDDPRDAGHLAHLAQVVANRSGRGDLEAVAWAYRGNALRACGKLVEADPLFEQAWLVLEVHKRWHGEADPFLRADITSLEASLRADQRRFDEAHTLLREARQLYEQAGSSDLDKLRVALQLASVNYYSGEPRSALSQVEKISSLVDPVRAPRLHLWTHHSLAVYLNECGQPEDAHKLLNLLRPLYHPASSPTHIRLEWLNGRIAVATGEYAAASRILISSTYSFLRVGQHLFAAFVCLDLAELYLKSGNLRDVESLLAALAQIFRSQRLTREATGSLLLLQKAASARRLTEDIISLVRQKLAASTGMLS